MLFVLLGVLGLFCLCTTCALCLNCRTRKLLKKQAAEQEQRIAAAIRAQDRRLRAAEEQPVVMAAVPVAEQDKSSELRLVPSAPTAPALARGPVMYGRP